MTESGSSSTTGQRQHGFIRRLGSIGDRPGDTPHEKLQHRFLVYMGVLMSMGALVWSGLSFAYGLRLPGMIPAFYLVLTAINLLWFATSKSFSGARAVQIFFSLLLPFVFQWTIGGFHASGAVMLWALVSLVGALTFTTPRTMIKWLVAYCALVIVSGAIDARVPKFAFPDGVRTAFFVVNIVMISAVVVALMFYFLDQREQALHELAEANAAIQNLQREVNDARKLGQYTLVEKLGEGGMGAVYRAKHALLRRATAIKLIRPDKANEAAIARFEREVQLTATLTHPNTVTIYDYGRTEDGTFFYVMEFLDGADLGIVVRLNGPLAAGRVVRVLAQVADALAEAHRRGLIHRDIKPANVLLTQTYAADVVKVVDFGLVKEVHATDTQHSVNQVGTITGTPMYMSPEAIARPDSIDEKTDVYSFGCLAYFLLTGMDVFPSTTTMEVCAHHLHTPPLPMSVRAQREVPRALEDLVMRCLAKQPNERPTARVVADTLRAYASEPWAAWNDSMAEEWWSMHSAALTEHRQKTAQSFDETVIARAAAPEQSHARETARGRNADDTAA
jgi:hypothetical protein